MPATIASCETRLSTPGPDRSDSAPGEQEGRAESMFEGPGDEASGVYRVHERRLFCGEGQMLEGQLNLCLSPFGRLFSRGHAMRMVQIRHLWREKEPGLAQFYENRFDI